MKYSILVAALLSVSLIGCSDRPQQYQQPVVYQQPAPVYQQPVVVQQHDNSAAALATGVALGHIMSNNTQYREPSRTIVNKTVIINRAPVPVQVPSTYGRSMPAPTPVTRQSLTIPPKAPAPVAPSYVPRNVVTPSYAQPSRPVVASYAPAKPATSYTIPARTTTSYSAPTRSTSSYSAPSRSSSFTATRSSSSTNSFKR